MVGLARAVAAVFALGALPTAVLAGDRSDAGIDEDDARTQAILEHLPLGPWVSVIAATPPGSRGARRVSGPVAHMRRPTVARRRREEAPTEKRGMRGAGHD